MGTPCFNIHIPIGSILYAPLFVFHEQNWQQKSPKFRFQIRRSDDIIKPDPIFRVSSRYKLSALTPTRLDPCFSPVVDSEVYLKNPKWKKSWFALGDPLRLQRLRIGRNNSEKISYMWVGNLIEKLCFWVAYERIPRTRLYNIAACHNRGMTGYHVAAALFGTRSTSNADFSPLAQSHVPGQEVDYFFAIFNQDKKRRHLENDNNIAFALATTEIAKLRWYKNLKGNDNIEVETLEKLLCQANATIDYDKTFAETCKKHNFKYAMTSVVMRSSDDPDFVPADGALEFMRNGLKAAIELLNEKQDEFLKYLICSLRRHIGYLGINKIPCISAFRADLTELTSAYSTSHTLGQDVLVATSNILEELIAFDLLHSNENLNENSPKLQDVINEVKNYYRADQWTDCKGKTLDTVR